MLWSGLYHALFHPINDTVLNTSTVKLSHLLFISFSKQLLHLKYPFFFRSSQLRSSIPKCTSQVQIKNHPDINIPCPPTLTKNGQYEFLEKDQPFSTAQTSCVIQSQSPKITLTSHFGSAEENSLAKEEGHLFASMEFVEQESPNFNQQVEALTKKRLKRGMAIDRTDSSGGTYYKFNLYCRFSLSRHQNKNRKPFKKLSQEIYTL